MARSLTTATYTARPPSLAGSSMRLGRMGWTDSCFGAAESYLSRSSTERSCTTAPHATRDEPLSWRRSTNDGSCALMGGVWKFRRAVCGSTHRATPDQSVPAITPASATSAAGLCGHRGRRLSVVPVIHPARSQIDFVTVPANASVKRIKPKLKGGLVTQPDTQRTVPARLVIVW